VLASLVLAACGSQASAPAAPTSNSSAPTSAPTSAPAETSAPTSAPASAPTTANTQAVSISHEGGELSFEGVPTRVVALEYSYVDALFALDEQPVAFADDGVPAYLAKLLQATQAQPVGTRNEPNLELLASLKPDLIIADRTRHEKIYQQLSQIGPTLLFDSYRGSFENQISIFETLSKVFRKEDLAKSVVANAREELAHARQLASGHERSLAIGVLAATGFTAHSNASFMGSLLSELGMTIPLSPKDGDTQFLLGLEGVAELNPQGFVITCSPEDRPLLDEWMAQPVWQQLDGVKQQQVYVFNRDLWSKSRGLIALSLVLRDARESGLLAGEPSRSATCPDAVEE
jgi:iron complex transport system substrate-binding protein